MGHAEGWFGCTIMWGRSDGDGEDEQGWEPHGTVGSGAVGLKWMLLKKILCNIQCLDGCCVEAKQCVDGEIWTGGIITG